MRATDKLPSRERQTAIIAELDAVVRALPPSRPLYSKDLAERIGTSARTLHSASVSVVGMSLHSYLRLKRLSNVRLQLSTGAVSVKAAALANGFWHLGDFSRVYRSAFGELPSQTRARAKQCRQIHLSPRTCPDDSKLTLVLLPSPIRFETA
ncbi:helix-turn-helix transcriptional regulator [Bradyrhizobium sp. 35]|uniref:helix-turn-helix transcriptional regulator n=1 Tax=Bradyrhizobium sp. 35 TaxID=2782670 RepID=UPI001FF9EE70|nr:helix-turn-helix transcriptional regulator [Bradyrhizobium sp. 35]MCK1453246.1 helix-turn-helix transcriptional regulator [Bradyrhizobium sp. 35]